MNPYQEQEAMDLGNAMRAGHDREASQILSHIALTDGRQALNIIREGNRLAGPRSVDRAEVINRFGDVELVNRAKHTATPEPRIKMPIDLHFRVRIY